MTRSYIRLVPLCILAYSVPMFAEQTPQRSAPANTIPASCAITTIASQAAFVPPAPYPAAAPSDRWMWVGTKELWVMAPADGIWRGIKQRSSAGATYGNKQFWMSEGFDGSAGGPVELQVTGRRVDNDGPTLVPSIAATNANHSDFGGWAMLVGVDLPPGCWEITGRYRGRSSSFVVWVPSLQ